MAPGLRICSQKDLTRSTIPSSKMGEGVEDGGNSRMPFSGVVCGETGPGDVLLERLYLKAYRIFGRVGSRGAADRRSSTALERSFSFVIANVGELAGTETEA